MKPGRNDPCPCGSGKKYKRCCIDVDHEEDRVTINAKGQFRFTPGSYGDGLLAFAPALLCLKRQLESKWIPHFCLIRDDLTVLTHERAVEAATADISAAFEYQSSPDPQLIAMKLRSSGYKVVPDYRTVAPGDSATKVGLRLGPDDPRLGVP